MTTSTKRPKYLSLRNAGELVGVSERTIRRRISDGDLRAYRVGTKHRGAIRVEETEVLELLRGIPTVGNLQD